MYYLMSMGMNELLIFAAIGIISYVLTSVGLYKLAKRENVHNAGLSWIPICNYYIIGLLLKGRFTFFNLKFDNPEVVLPFFAVVVLIGSQIPSFGLVLCIGAGIPIIASIYHMILKYKGTQVWIWTIVCTLIPLVYAALLVSFSIKSSVANNS
jgi:hypothetical protein